MVWFIMVAEMDQSLSMYRLTGSVDGTGSVEYMLIVSNFDRNDHREAVPCKPCAAA